MRQPRLIYCAAGNKRFADIALRYGQRVGAQLPGTVYHAPYLAFELSCLNLAALWAGCRALIRFAVDADIAAILKIARQYRNELGYVMPPALRESVTRRTLLVAEYGGRVVGFVNYRARRDGGQTINDAIRLRVLLLRQPMKLAEIRDALNLSESAALRLLDQVGAVNQSHGVYTYTLNEADQALAAAVRSGESRITIPAHTNTITHVMWFKGETGVTLRLPLEVLNRMMHAHHADQPPLSIDERRRLSSFAPYTRHDCVIDVRRGNEYLYADAPYEDAGLQTLYQVVADAARAFDDNETPTTELAALAATQAYEAHVGSVYDAARRNDSGVYEQHGSVIAAHPSRVDHAGRPSLPMGGRFIGLYRHQRWFAWQPGDWIVWRGAGVVYLSQTPLVQRYCVVANFYPTREEAMAGALRELDDIRVDIRYADAGIGTRDVIVLE